MKTLSTILVPLLLASLMLFSNAAAEEKQDVSTFLKTISENVSFSTYRSRGKRRKRF